MKKVFLWLFIFLNGVIAHCQTPLWGRFEHTFTSQAAYDNPLYEVEDFTVTFQAPSGRTKTVRGFWDGAKSWKVRFMPDEMGGWSFTSLCSDEDNTGLHNVSGSFECVSNSNQHAIYQKGPIMQPQGTYHLSHYDGTPFFWTACTAWNGALKSTEQEWETYLTHRANHHYNTIQLVTTQWRGCAKNAEGEVAFTGSGKIQLNPDFFQRIDQKMDEVNAHGLVAAPVLLWALPFGQATELSPGYYLPIREAVLLAKHIVARYQAHHVVWILGGDGKYDEELEDRWKAIGSQVFGDQQHQGLVSLHPHGRSWIGEIYQDEPWLDIIGYQSSHSNGPRTVNWINQGPMAEAWDDIPPQPIINMEPNYEEIHFKIDAEDVRNASYWSLFATPLAGITYGANGIWPWLREGEHIENHEDAPGTHRWHESIDFPGSLQIGYLHDMIRQFAWWTLRPAPELLVAQPGKQTYHHFISVVADPGHTTVLAYTPAQQPVQLYNTAGLSYQGKWYDPIQHKTLPAELEQPQGHIVAVPPASQDMVLILEAK